MRKYARVDSGVSRSCRFQPAWRSEAIRALLAEHPQARDVEIEAAGLEQAFLALTGDGGEAAR